MIYLQLFLSFLQVGMFSVGGGYAAMPLIQSQVVNLYGWLSMNEFTDLVTIAEMTPGPIAVNAATFVGMRISGVPGALVATFGVILPPCIIVSVLAYIYRRYRKLSALQNVLACLRPAVVALIAAAGCTILQLVAFSGKDMAFANVNFVALIIFVLALVALNIKLPQKKKALANGETDKKETRRINPILVMFACGVIYLVAALIAEEFGITLPV